jgi:hypothetical protein
MQRLQSLRLEEAAITDEGMSRLPRLPNVSYLDMRKTKITDVALKHLQRLPNLARLYLDETQIADAGLVDLQELRHLTVLTLGKTHVSDAGLVYLGGIHTQRLCISLGGARVSSAAAREFRKALPNFEICR